MGAESCVASRPHSCVSLSNFPLGIIGKYIRLFIPCIFCTYCNRVTNGCNCLFCVFISFIFTLHVSGSHKPIIRGISSCFYIQPFGSALVMSILMIIGS